MTFSWYTLSKEQLDALTDIFSDKEISSSFGLSRTACTYKRKLFGVLSYAQKHKQRKYSNYNQIVANRKRSFGFVKEGANEHFFDHIDTCSKAYWLGLIYADGWIVTHKSKPTGFALALKGEDRYLLDRFSFDLGHANMVRQVRLNADLFQVKMTSEHAALKLIDNGVVPRKSFCIRLPTLKASYYPFFIRGYFDGDGSVYVRNNSISMKFTSGSKEFLVDLQKHLKENAEMNSTLKSSGNYSDLLFYATNVLNFSRYIYCTTECQDLFMSRKREKVFGFKGSGAGHSWGELLSGLDSLPSR